MLDMKTIREELHEWTEIEGVIDVFAVAYGLLKPGERFPKAYYWSSGYVTDILSDSIFKLVNAGVLERRDDQQEIEIRWNPKYAAEVVGRSDGTRA